VGTQQQSAHAFGKKPPLVVGLLKFGAYLLRPLERLRL
jgi:hypothetical protein